MYENKYIFSQGKEIRHWRVVDAACDKTIGSHHGSGHGLVRESMSHFAHKSGM